MWKLIQSAAETHPPNPVADDMLKRLIEVCLDLSRTDLFMEGRVPDPVTWLLLFGARCSRSR